MNSSIISIKPKLLLKLSEIDIVIRNNYKKEEHLGVLVGLSGLSLFQFYYAKLLDSDINSEIGISILENSFDILNKGYSYPTFCKGIIGFSWTLEHLSMNNFIDIDCDVVLENFDYYILKHLDTRMNLGDFDFMHGGMGGVLYYLTRFYNTKNLKFRDDYYRILEQFVDKIWALKEKLSCGIGWPSIFNSEGEKSVNYDFGLAHGMASIINILSRLYHFPKMKTKISFMIEEATAFMLNYKFLQGTGNSFYPNFVSDGVQDTCNSRISWCYGDLGIGLSLWLAGKNIENYSLMSEGLSALKHSAQRRISTDSKVVDSGFCHGSFGIAKIFQRLYKETGDQDFDDASTFWLNDGLKRDTHNDGYSGFKQWVSQSNSYENKISLLEGVAGIGLVIIDFLENRNNSWDQCLLLS